MVNHGRSGGCLTCKQRRVKCDEAKPQCRACQRLELRCGGYSRPNKYAKLRFRDQNYKFCTSTGQDRDCHRRRDLAKAATSPSRLSSSLSDVQPREIVRSSPTLLHHLSEPDTSIPFYLAHYASLGRDLGSTRGFFELLIPAYSSSPSGSPLSLAVSALSSEILSLWRHDPTSFRAPRKAYARALRRLRIATHNTVERRQPATLLAVLTLQTYENACAIYNLRGASSTHHDGAASLLPLLDSPNPSPGDDEVNGRGGGGGGGVMMRTYLRKFMLHTEVSTAMRQEKPLRTIAYSFFSDMHKTPAVPDNPSSALDAIGTCVADLQASYTQLTTQGGGFCPASLDHLLTECRAEARRIDTELVDWADNVPAYWKPLRLLSSRDIDESIPTYRSVCEVYPSIQIASIWNLWRVQRLLLAKIMLGCLSTFSTLQCSGFPSIQFLADDDSAELVKSRQTIQEMVDGACYSIPFYLGNRTTRSSLADFDDPTILLPSHFSLLDGTLPLLNTDRFNGGVSRENHRRAVIAQGPWRVMHPLSRLLTLFTSKEVDYEDGGLMASCLRPGQRDWIREQFLRVATLLHLPLSRLGPDVEGSGGSSVDARAEYLARQVRKGAVLMSGP